VVVIYNPEARTARLRFMPLYEYECESCGTRIERIQRFADPPLTTCEKCGGSLRKLLSSPAIQFKGSGWYITDYARKPESSSSKPVDGSKPAEGGGSDAPAPAKEPAAKEPAAKSDASKKTD
jgi:putative FmdB family regulatory protein